MVVYVKDKGAKCRTTVMELLIKVCLCLLSYVDFPVCLFILTSMQITK